MIGRRRWREVDALLERVLELPVDERDAILAAECADDPELSQQVLSLLAAEKGPDPLSPAAVSSHTRAEWLLNELAEAAGPELESLQGTTIGPYTLGSELGRGGMAVVYAAERTDHEFDQRVAIKLLLSGSQSSASIERFRRERRILASLDHPNITRLLDGGAGAQGRPYLVMERVDGEPIDRYCSRQQLGLRSRLQLWLAVAEAVAYAHRRLLVHRDLKPANVMVTASGQVKLLDFGIAKVLDDLDPQFADLTRTGLRPMTLRYASPEQISEHGLTTATDIYQLGLLLHELLCGRSPYRIKEGRTVEWQDAIRHQEPTKPSQALLRSPCDSDLTAGKMEQKLAARSKQLAGDLDAIVLKALRKAPDQRYSSVEAMRDDVERYLSGLPVLARQGTLVYRSRRFLHRHRGGVVVGLMAVGLLALLVAFHGYRLAEQRDRAVHEAHKAERVTSFLTELFRGGNPAITGRDDLSAADLLDRGAERIGEELADQPEVRSEVQSVIGRSYLALGRFEEAETMQEAALATARESFGDRSEDVAEILSRLGLLHSELGHYQRADELLRESLAIRRGIPEADPLDLASALNNLGLVSNNQGKRNAAREYFEETIQIKERVLGPDHPSLARSLTNQASTLYGLRQFDQSKEVSRRAVAIFESGGDPLSPAIASALSTLANALRETGDLEEAREHLERALVIKERAYGGEHPRLAGTHNILGNVLRNLGDVDGARRAYERALSIYRLGYGDDHPRVATPLTNLGLLWLENGEPLQALPRLQEALRIRTASLRAEHPRVVQTRVRIARAAVHAGDHATAEPQLRQAIELLRLPNGSDGWLSEALLLLGGLLTDTGRAQEAEPMLRESLTIRTESFGRDDRETALVLVALGRCLQRLGRASEADKLVAEVTERFQDSDPELVELARLAQ